MASNLDKKVVTGDALVSILTQSVTSMNNKLNNRPCISIDPGTGHFIINEVDSGVKAVGEDGTAFTKITMDTANNVIGTLSDGTTVNLGNLSINIQGDFLTSGGFGNIRYYNGKFQYNNSGTWTDIATTNNDLLLGITPSPMKRIKVKYDETLGKNTLILIPPNDTIIDGQTLCFVEKVVVRRKKDSIPDSITDGEEVLTLNRSDFENYQKVPYVDQNCAVSKDDIWYYRAFPMSTLGLTNLFVDENTGSILDATIYGFHIDQNESDPSSMITYIEDNADFIPAYMDYSTDSFDYGSWKDVWFIKGIKPCMLNYDGTVAYELDPNDYSKKKDGTPSDIVDASFNGNAMVGIPKVYYKIVDNGDDTANVYISDKKVDNDYHCWSHIDNNGNEIDYCYMPIYRGYVKDSKMRSLSGVIASSSYTAEQEITFAKANNLSSDEIWYTFVWCDKVIIDLLLMLIGKSTDTQTVFGKGKSNYSDGGTDESKACGTGDTKGLFWGGNTGKEVVKVFGMENYWGSSYYRMAGMAQVNGNFVVKMTYSTNDGTTTNGYDIDGKGYINILKNTLSSSPGYVTKMKYTPYGIFPIECKSGSASTYYCDAGYFYAGSTTCYPFFGGESSDGARCGIFSYEPYYGKTRAVSWLGTAISCKPLASTQNS